MKKVFAILAATVLFSAMATAQLGINVGYAPQTYKNTYTYSDGTTSTSVSEMNGFFAGVNYNINLTGDLNVSVGADFRYNTSSDTTAGSIIIASGSVKNTHTQMLIDVPILFNYGLKLTDALKISVFVGPTVSYALSGNTHTTTTVNVLGTVTTKKSDSDWYGDNSSRKKLDIGGTIGVNLQYNDLRIFGGYNLGLLNTTDASNYTLKGSNYFVGIGYLL